MRYLRNISTLDNTGSGYARSVRVVGKKAYVADGEAGICVLDLDEQQAPLFLSSPREPWSMSYAEDVDICGDVMCIANGEGGACVMDLRTGMLSQVDTRHDINANALQVRCNNKQAYVANGGMGLAVISLLDFSIRHLPITCSDGHRVAALGLATCGGKICIASGYAGLSTVDSSDLAANPLRVPLPGYSEKVFLAQRTAYVTSGAFGLHAVNLGDMRVYRFFSFPPELSGYAHDVKVQGSKAYVAAGPAGLISIDILNGGVDSLNIGRYVSDAYALSLEVVGHRAYLACGAAGLAVVELDTTSTAHQQDQSLNQGAPYLMSNLMRHEVTQSTINEREVSALRSLLAEGAGFHPNWSTGPGFQEQVAYRVRDCGFSGFDDYHRWLRSGESVDEIHHLLDSWTVFPAWFFKDSSCFRTLENLLDQIVASCLESKRTELRLLSVGCGAGEEPYTLAMQLLDNESKLKGLAVRILAVDVNHHALNKAERGCFQEHAFRSIPIQTRHLYFKRAGDYEQSYQIDPRIRQSVTFRHENLLSLSGETRQFGPNIIFCRNVVSYMDRSMQNTAIDNLYAMLVGDGYLFLGSSERLPSSAADSFRTALPSGTMLFQKSGFRHRLV